MRRLGLGWLAPLLGVALWQLLVSRRLVAVHPRVKPEAGAELRL